MKSTLNKRFVFEDITTIEPSKKTIELSKKIDENYRTI